MFQRQARQPFPARNIIILATAVLLFLLYILKNAQKVPPQQAFPIETETADKPKGDSLFPNEWWYLSREYPRLQPDLMAYENALSAVMQSTNQRGGYPGFSLPWTVQGPGNIGARINTIKVHPGNPAIIYIGYSNGGVWKTINGGANWQPIFDDQPYLSISDIELDPKNPETVYVGTGDHNIGAFASPGLGLFKSTDGGKTWKASGLQNQRIVSKIVIDPNNPNTLYAAAMGFHFQKNKDRGLYKSTDGGQSWQQVLFVADQAGIIDVVMAPNNPNILFAASWDRIRNDKIGIVSGTNSRIWKSTDAGKTWTKLDNVKLPSGNQSRIGLAVTPGSPNSVIALQVDSTYNVGGIYQSPDSGQNWIEIPTDSLGEEVMRSFGWYFGKIFINPFNSNDLFVCGVELWRSKDGGKNWYRTTPEWWLYEVHADMHDMAFINAQTFLLATDGGLYKTVNAGETWTKIENNPCSQFYRVAHNPHNPEWYYGGMQDNGTSGGNADVINDWPRLFGGDGFQAQFHPEKEEIFYFETQNGKIWGTEDGSFLREMTDGMDGKDRRNWDMPYFISTHTPTKMYTGTYRVYRSDSHPAFWSPISEDLTDGNVLGARFHTISAICESPLEEDLLYVGTSDANVWRMDPDFSWTNITQGLPERYVSSLRASTENRDRVFVTLTGYQAGSNTPHVFRSDDKGKTWQNIAGDLPDMAVNDLFVLPGKRDSVLFVATDFGVYGSMNGGKHWERLGKGLPFVPVYDLEHNPKMRTLVAGTYARSIVTFPLDSLRYSGSVSISEPDNTLQNALTVMPSPANNFIQISVNQAIEPLNTEVLIFDAKGKLVVQQSVGASGVFEERVMTNDYPSGVYCAMLRQQGKVLSHKKFVVQH